MTRYFNYLKTNEFFKETIIISIPGINSLQEQNEIENKKSYINNILSSQLAMSDFLIVEKLDTEELENKEEIINNELEQEHLEENIVISDIKENVQTEVIAENNIKPTFTDEYDGVQIKNTSKYSLTEEVLIPNVELDNTKDILIFHTHTCESYTPSEKFNYVMTGNYRTTDYNYSVVRVGDELQRLLQQYGFNVIHDKTYNDYPEYTGSYSRSSKVVKNILNENDCNLVIDLHRDAIGSNSNYAPTVKIGDEYVAQLMFVIGTDGGGLTHTDWQQNLKFAVKIQQIANKIYPGLFRPIILRNSRYNQHLAKGACIIEVGATGNTLEQCLGSMKYLAKIINEAMGH